METRDLNMTFIGVGNMGEALLGGVLRSRITTKERAVIHDVNPKRLRKTERIATSLTTSIGKYQEPDNETAGTKTFGPVEKHQFRLPASFANP